MPCNPVFVVTLKLGSQFRDQAIGTEPTQSKNWIIQRTGSYKSDLFLTYGRRGGREDLMLIQGEHRLYGKESTKITKYKKFLGATY